MTKPFAWSYSVLDLFENCPKRYYHLKIAKDVKETPSKEMAEGNAVHKALELRVKDNVRLPDRMQKWEPLVHKLCTSPGQVFAEQQLALDSNLKPVTWFDKRAWVRGIVDVGIKKGHRAVAFDYKTGKPKKDIVQMKLFAALMFAHNPALEQIGTGFIWLNHGMKVDKEDFTRDQVSEIWADFMPRVERITNAIETNRFPPKPSGLCNGWCPVGRDKCEFAGERR